MKKCFAMYARPIWVTENGKCVAKVGKPERVQVMAVAKGYAMVRFPRCVPFIVRENDLDEDL